MPPLSVPASAPIGAAPGARASEEAMGSIADRPSGTGVSCAGGGATCRCGGRICGAEPSRCAGVRGAGVRGAVRVGDGAGACWRTVGTGDRLAEGAGAGAGVAACVCLAAGVGLAPMVRGPTGTMPLSSTGPCTCVPVVTRGAGVAVVSRSKSLACWARSGPEKHSASAGRRRRTRVISWRSVAEWSYPKRGGAE